MLDNQYTAERVGQNDPQPRTSEKIATENKVSEKTVRNAEQLYDQTEALGADTRQNCQHRQP